MAGNTVLDVMSGGDTIATDDIGGVKHQQVKVEWGTGGTATPVSAANPMPVVQTGTPTIATGAATSAKQDTGNTSIANIDTKTPALGQALAAASVPVVLTAAQLTTITPPAAITGYATAAAQTDKSQFVKMTDGTDTALVTAAGEQNVLESNSASALTSLQLIDDVIYTDDTSTHATGTSKGALFMAAATPTDASVNANDIGAVAMTTDRKLHVSVQDALPAGTNGIGKLTANSGVTIGAVELAAAQTLATVTTLSGTTTLTPGTGATNLGKAEDAGHTTGDVGVFVLGVRNDTLADVTNTTADYSQQSTDIKGRVMVAGAPRLLKGTFQVQLSNTTTETTILAATASTFHDVYGIILANTGASTTKVSIRDDTAGTVRAIIEVPALETRGFMLPVDSAVPQTAVNKNWTAQCGTATTALEVTGFYVSMV